MWKQFINKLSKKSAKPEFAAESTEPEPGSSVAASGNVAQQRQGGGNAVAGRAAATMKRMSSVIFPSTVVAGIEPLLSFKDVPNNEKPNLFISKLNLCGVIFDFSDPNKNAAEKELKRQALMELSDYVNTATMRLTEPMIGASCRMFAVNLFRVFPPNNRSNTSTGGENDEEEPMFDPAWSHLQGVYDLLLRFVSCSSLDAKFGKKYFDHPFILSLLELFNSEDPRERDCLKTVLHRIYGKFMVHRPFIRMAVSNIFYRFVFETDRHNGIAELLEVFGSVISGFALPLKEEHKAFLCKALLPLHKPRTVGIYLQQLTYCVIQFVEKDPKLASSVILGLLKYWPITNSQKEVMFLSEMEEVLESTDMDEFQKCMVPLFKRIAHCINSSHFQVAERALFMWNNDRVMGLVAQNRHAITPIVLPALERNACGGHWNPAAQNLTLNARKMLCEMDEELFVSCQRKLEEEKVERATREEKRRMEWERMESAAAATAVQPAVLVSAASPPVSLVVPVPLSVVATS